MDVAKLLGMALCCIALVLLFLATTADDWYGTNDYYFGLWRLCWRKNKTCHFHGMKTQAYIHVTRAAMVIATLFSFVSFLGYLISFHTPRIGSVSVLRVTSALSIIGSFFLLIALIAFSILAAKQNRRQYRYNVAWACCGLLLLSGVLALRREHAPTE
ncbi:hypothetical protein lerEdw1_009648 [Lerista edwardsae]|nr:hypothetical protein lerEdw1_009648 [Lerista edwardsae]